MDQLEKYGWLKKEDYEIYDSEDDDICVDYGKLYKTRYPILRKAFHNSKISNSEDFQNFCKEESSWLEDYALYMALKEENAVSVTVSPWCFAR